MMSTLNRLQMRLFAAAMVFYVLVLTVQVDPFAHYMGAAAFFGLLAIPIRVVLVIVEIADSLTGGVSTSAPAKHQHALGA